MAEELELKVTAQTGEAVSNLKATEKAVDGVTKATDKLDQSAKKASDSVGKVGKSGKEAEQGVGAVGDALNKTTGGFAKLMEATGKITLIFGAAVAAGKALGAALEYLVTSVSKSAAAKQEAEARSIKFASALKLAEKGVIDLGRSTDDMLRNYDAYIAKMREATAATEAQARAVAEYEMTLGQLSEIVGRANQQTGFSIMSPEQAAAQLDSMRALAAGLNDVLGKAFSEGGASERDAWAQANKDAIQKVIDEFAKFGVDAPAQVKAAYDAMKAGAEGLAEPTIAELQKMVEAATQMRMAAEEQGNAMREQTTAQESATRAQQQWTDATHDGVTEMNGWVGVAGPATVMMFQYAAATKEAKDALLGFLEAQRALREEQAAALEGTQGWLSILSNLKDSFESGETSLYNYITQLQGFDAQVRQLFGGATGEAKTAVDALTSAIAELIRTATGGKEYSPGMAGYLEREIDRSRKGR